MNTVDSFLSKLEQDQGLANNFNALIKDQDGEGLIQMLKDNGVSKADWESYVNSMNTVDQFSAKLATDEALAKQVSELAERKDSSAIVELMKDNGVTQADIDAVDARVKAQIENGELSEDMLEEVAGGIAPVIVAGGITGGAAVAAAGVGAVGALGAAAIAAVGGVAVEAYKKWA